MIYFAYESDMNPARLAERCPGHRSLGVARLPRHRLWFPRYSRDWGCAIASIAPSDNDVVFGVLYDLPADEVPVLHYHRGYEPSGQPEHNDHVFRDVTVVRAGRSEPVKAWTYVAVPDGTTALPSVEYMNAVIDGARIQGLPRAYIVRLQSWKTA